ncbi:thioredoxin-like associated protein 2, putative [Plasmodium gallinaceum]|uniref:Thioredoxin-like associated protein 2, putative n=1 Tax=Plasmodium gallinaceum TaxID=5849 RepID=A0A1J1GYG7_PLAGA|nr:thioredoxin-like associated protein 2, putative [Plasmodium gallinaceum]CRG97359.1 thioredoxin-like associated protein 2, putative [Plasmodium gallinaceum]
MYTNQRSNYEYTNPMVLNANHNNLGPYKNERITDNSSIISQSRHPLQINYNKYTQQNINTNPYNSQSKLNRSEKSTNYINYYRNVDNFPKSPLKYSFSQFIPKNKNIGKPTTALLDSVKQKDLKNNLNYELKVNSVRTPLNFNAKNTTPLKPYYKNNPEFFYQNKKNDLNDNIITSIEKERSKNYTTAQKERYNNVDTLIIKEQKFQNVPLNKKNDVKKENENLGDSKKYKENENIYAKKIQENVTSEMNKIRENEKKEKTEEKKVNKIMELKNKNESVTNEKTGYAKEKDIIKKINKKEENLDSSLYNHNNKKNKKIKFKNETLIYINNKSLLPCVISLDFNDDSINLNKGLKTFENMIIIDKNNILRKWNGFEWEKIENNFNFFIKARYDNQGNIWCINNSFEVLKLIKNKFKNFGNLANEEIIDIGFDKKNTLWCINRKGELLKWSRTKWNKIKYKGFHKLTCVSFDNKGDLWGINSKRALAVWNKKDKCWNEKLIKDNLKISCIDFDTNDKIWVISNAGALLSYSCGNWMNFGLICLEELISISFKKQ